MNINKNIMVCSMVNQIVYNTKECPLNPGFYIIPDYERYAINPDGVLIERINAREIIWRVTAGFVAKNIKGGYRRALILSDMGKRKSVSRHRLLALIFKPLPPDHHSKVINHLNGVPGSDHLDNLEWSTYSKNTKHAYRNGLYPNKVRSVEVYLPDGTTIVYDLRIVAIEETGIKEHTFDNMLKQQGRVLTTGFGVRYADSNIGWYCKTSFNRLIIPYYAKNLLTGVVMRFPDSHSLAEYLKVPTRSVQGIFNVTHPVIGEYQIKKHVDKPWIKYTSLEAEYLIKCPRRIFPERICAVKDDMAKEFFDYIEAAKFLGVKGSTYVKTLANDNRSFNGWKLSSYKVL